ncbi:hypothetical protein [Aeoliella sp.]|uniref:hypothetical protein n=1 Tax=Aeoliella sp. TaxID=2795800 RepID=UPI003CCBFE34
MPDRLGITSAVFTCCGGRFAAGVGLGVDSAEQAAAPEWVASSKFAWSFAREIAEKLLRLSLQVYFSCSGSPHITDAD